MTSLRNLTHTREEPRTYPTLRLSQRVEPHEDIDGQSCDGELEAESDETLYCSECGAVLSRETGEVLGHGTPMHD